MPKFNDFDLTPGNWKKYEDILTDSLWIINERDKKNYYLYYYFLYLIFINYMQRKIL
jgi:hypothetical protein